MSFGTSHIWRKHIDHIEVSSEPVPKYMGVFNTTLFRHKKNNGLKRPYLPWNKKTSCVKIFGVPSLFFFFPYVLVNSIISFNII